MGAQRQRCQRLRCQSSWKCSLQGCTQSAEGSKHKLDAPILGARQDPTELDLGNVSRLAENKHLLYNFQLNIIQLLKHQGGNSRDCCLRTVDASGTCFSNAKGSLCDTCRRYHLRSKVQGHRYTNCQ